MIRAAIIGCGRHTQNTLVHYLKLLDGIEYQASVDPVKQSADYVKTLLRAKHSLTSLRELNIEEVDIAIVATPPVAAYETTKYLIKNSISCFVEKPPAPGTDQIKELYELSLQYGAQVQIGFNYRFSNALVAIKTILQNEIIALTTLDFKSKYPFGAEWETSDPMEAWLRHNGIHAFDLLRSLSGDIVLVNANVMSNASGRFLIQAQSLHKNNSLSILRLGNITGYFDIGIDVHTLLASRVHMSNLNDVRLVADKGELSDRIIYKTKNLDNGWAIAGYGPELLSFLNSFRTSSPPSPSLEDAYKASLVCDAILVSINTKNMGVQVLE